MQQLAQARQHQQQLQQRQPPIPPQHLGPQGGMGAMNVPPHLATAGQMTPSSLVQQAQLARSRELEQFGRLPMAQLQQQQQQQQHQQQQQQQQQQSSPHQSQQQQSQSPAGHGPLNANGLPFDLNSMTSAQVQMLMQHRMQQQQQQQKLAQLQQLGQFSNNAGMINPQTVAQGMRSGFPTNMQFPPGLQPAQLQQLMNAQMPMGMYGMGGQQGQNANAGMDPATMMRMSQQR